ncbi:hypothetical protein ACJMK2_012565, partial [Sinanodonta woodiana]
MDSKDKNRIPSFDREKDIVTKTAEKDIEGKNSPFQSQHNSYHEKEYVSDVGLG